MGAPEKMIAVGMKALEERTGRNLVTLYRWRQALIEGRGIRDANKKLLIEATADLPDPITWGDFIPEAVA